MDRRSFFRAFSAAPAVAIAAPAALPFAVGDFGKQGAPWPKLPEIESFTAANLYDLSGGIAQLAANRLATLPCRFIQLADPFLRGGDSVRVGRRVFKLDQHLAGNCILTGGVKPLLDPASAEQMLRPMFDELIGARIYRRVAGLSVVMAQLPEPITCTGAVGVAAYNGYTSARAIFSYSPASLAQTLSVDVLFAVVR